MVFRILWAKVSHRLWVTCDTHPQERCFFLSYIQFNELYLFIFLHSVWRLCRASTQPNHCTDVMYCTHSEPSDRAAHMTSPVTQPSAPWSPAWDKNTHTQTPTHTHPLRPRILTVWSMAWMDYFPQSSNRPLRLKKTHRITVALAALSKQRKRRTKEHGEVKCALYPAVCWLVRRRIFTSSWMNFTRLRALKKSWKIKEDDNEHTGSNKGSRSAVKGPA